MNLFSEKLRIILAAKPFYGSQKGFVEEAKGIDRSQLSRVLTGMRTATPELVGRICGALPAEHAKTLLVAYLTDVAAETAAAYPKSQKTDQVRISVQTQVPVLSARNIE